MPNRLQRLVPLAAAFTGLVAATGAARGDTQLVFRLGVEPLSLKPSADTPYVGSHVDDAVTAYNAAATAYNRAHGLSANSPMAASAIDEGDLGLDSTLMTLAPGIETGGHFVRFRAEALFGFADHVHAVGIGLYPIDIAIPLDHVTPYFVAGGTLRWLNRTDTEGETGGLGTLRAAAGARIGRHALVELGVSLYMVGGMYNQSELESMARSYDPRGSAPPPDPERVVSGGTQSGMIDVSVGFAL